MGAQNRHHEAPRETKEPFKMHGFTIIRVLRGLEGVVFTMIRVLHGSEGGQPTIIRVLDGLEGGR